MTNRLFHTTLRENGFNIAKNNINSESDLVKLVKAEIVNIGFKNLLYTYYINLKHINT